MPAASQKGVATTLLAPVTTGTGLGVAVPITSKNPRVHIIGAGTISGGTLIIEEALDPSYSGTWSQLLSVTASSLTGGAEQVLHILGTLSAIRARISSNITGGGTIAVTLVSD